MHTTRLTQGAHGGHVVRTAMADTAAEALITCYVLVVMASCVVLVAGLAAARRSGGPPGLVHDPYEAAFLAGGPGRVADAAFAALHEDGRLAVAGPGIAGIAPGAVPRHPAEGAVFDMYAAAPSGALHALRAAVMRAPAVQAIGDGLAARGLMVPPAVLRPWRRRAVAHLLVSGAGVPLGFLLTVAAAATPGSSALANASFVQTFPVALLGAGVGVFCARGAQDRATGAGRSALRRYRSGAGVPQASGAAHQVALRGLHGVQDRELRGQLAAAHRFRARGRRSAAYAGYGVLPVYAAAWCAGSACGGPSCGTAARDAGRGGWGGGSGSGGGSGCGDGGGCGGGSGCGGGGCGGGGGGGGCGGG